MKATSFVVSLIALGLSLLSAAYTVRTYAVSQRPYIGIIDAPVGLMRDKNNNPKDMSWRVVLENTGAIPGWGQIKKHKTFVCCYEDGKEVEMRYKEDAEETGLFIMPGGKTTINGKYPIGSNIPLEHVLSKKATLKEEIAISYRKTSDVWWVWWDSEYYYNVTLKLSSTSEGLLFTMLVGKAN